MGASNTGKSCVLKKLWELLPGEEVEVFSKGARYNITGIKAGELNSFGMCTVGDVPNGDDGNSIQSGLALMVKKKCDVIICACHSREQFFKAIENLETTIINNTLANAGVTQENLSDIKNRIKTEYQIIGCGHFCDWNIEPLSITKSGKTNAEVGGVDLTEFSAISILNFLNSLNR